MKKEIGYCMYPRKDGSFYPTTFSPPMGWTFEQDKEHVIKNGARIITKAEYEKELYERAFARIKAALESENVAEVFETCRWNDNKYSIRAFSEITGVKLSPVMKERVPQLIEYFGDKFEAYVKRKAEARAEAAKKRREEEAARQREYIASLESAWHNGDYVSGTQFLELCVKHGIELHPRIKRSISKNVFGINKEGSTRIRYGAKNSGGFASAFWTLKERMEKPVEQEPVSETIASLFTLGEVKM